MHKECATGQETLESLSLAIEAHTVPTLLANQRIIVSNKIPLLHHPIQARKVREVKVAQIWDSLQQQFLGYESAPKQSRVIFVTVRWGHVCGSFQGSGPSTWPGIEKFLHLRLRVGRIVALKVKLRFHVRLRFWHRCSKDFIFDGVLGLGLDSLSQTPAFNFLQAQHETSKARTAAVKNKRTWNLQAPSDSCWALHAGSIWSHKWALVLEFLESNVLFCT